ncbi:MAG: hypothetical protein CM15mP127_12400 [Gammaproteobacteria bacterium]|nr:MAG: hypothetical protein CM15mP127_12400 [Gammaproteobacteria bacterium]
MLSALLNYLKKIFCSKKIILVIGDGVGFNHIKLARLFEGGPKFNTAVDRMPISGIVTNYSFDDLYTDSAASGTAWATGVKTKNRFWELIQQNKRSKIFQRF